MISLLKQQDDEIHSLYSVITSYQIKERMKLDAKFFVFIIPFG